MRNHIPPLDIPDEMEYYIVRVRTIRIVKKLPHVKVASVIAESVRVIVMETEPEGRAYQKELL